MHGQGSRHTEQLHTAGCVPVIHESARLLSPPPQISTLAAAQDLCSGSRAHPTVPTKPPGVQETGGLVSGTGASCCWNVEDSG